jgi:hypothetical protein
MAMGTGLLHGMFRVQNAPDAGKWRRFLPSATEAAVTAVTVFWSLITEELELLQTD